MENPKSQIPNPKQIPKLKLQTRPVAVGSIEWWEETGTAGKPMLLRDGPTATGNGRPFDLEERTAQFGEEILRLCKKIHRAPDNDRIIGQLAGCGTSVGANYREANEPVSKKDFLLCIGRCLKEAKETMFFLRMAAAAEPAVAEKARELYREAKELVLILSSMRRKQ